MAMQEVLGKLRSTFGLGEKHTLILRILEKEKLDARSIAEKADIPYGRIYSYLNELLEHELIEKTTKKPHLYYISDFKDNIVGFMRNKIEQQLKTQSEVLRALTSKGGTEHIEIIANAEQFTQAHINLISEGQQAKFISVHNSLPYILYPDKFEDFMLLRKTITANRPTITDSSLDTTLLIFRAYRDAMIKGKKLWFIFERSTFERHMTFIKERLGKKFLKLLIEEAIERIEKYGVGVYIIDEYTTMQIDLNEHRVVLCLKYLGTVNGIQIVNKDVVKFFESIYDQNIKKGQSVVPIFKKMLKTL